VDDDVVVADCWQQVCSWELGPHDLQIQCHDLLDRGPCLVLVSCLVMLSHSVLDEVAIHEDGIDFRLLGEDRIDDLLHELLGSLLTIHSQISVEELVNN
jgi:hypothetical protein